GSVLNEFFSPDILPLTPPELSIKTTSSKLNIVWDGIAYPDPIHYELTIIPETGAPIYITTEETELSLNVPPVGVIEVRTVCPSRELESSINKYEYALKGLFVAPNPVRKSDNAFIRCLLPESVDKITFRLYDIAGNRILIKEQSVNSLGEFRIPLNELLRSELSTGVYFLSLSYNGYNERTKFVIIR
ncbi:MAG: T9SS type A sorting domain-containing protein, partial [Candidatus Cloacimonetes bacterium]|nr:T9SS type A sorting domain-containing protein [Candidatus Cloacimonadota bacterium]